MSTVLIVEDDLAVSENLIELFKFKGYSVLNAKDGEAGYAVAVKRMPDIIISDIMMPKKDGYELLKMVRENPTITNTPVILLTAKTMTESKIKGLEYGADDYVTKPFNVKELSARVHNLLELRKKLKTTSFHDSTKSEVESVENVFLGELLVIFHGNMENSEFAIESVVEIMGLSKSTIQRRVKDATDKTFNQLLREYRLEQAKNILSQKGGNVSEVAYKVGFNSVSYFSYSYKNYFGHPPTEKA